jgi:hypothetical protein
MQHKGLSIDSSLRLDPEEDLRRRLELANRRVCELRDQVQKQINLRVAAEQRAGNRNVALLEARVRYLNERLHEEVCENYRLRRELGCPKPPRPL